MYQAHNFYPISLSSCLDFKSSFNSPEFLYLPLASLIESFGIGTMLMLWPSSIHSMCVLGLILYFLRITTGMAVWPLTVTVLTIYLHLLIRSIQDLFLIVKIFIKFCLLLNYPCREQACLFPTIMP